MIQYWQLLPKWAKVVNGANRGDQARQSLRHGSASRMVDPMPMAALLRGLFRSGGQGWFKAWSAICRRSVASMRAKRGVMDARARRIATNVSVIRTDAANAVGEFNTDANMIMPCSVNAYGRYLVPPRFEVANCDLKTLSPVSAPLFEVAICDLKSTTSSAVN